MNKMLKNIIIMAIVLVIAILAFIFVPKIEPKVDDTQMATAEPTDDPAEYIISDYSTEDVAKVTLVNDGVTSVVLYDEANDNYYLEGYEDLALNQTDTRNIVYTAAYVEVEKIITDDMSNLAEFGLEEPVSKVITEFKDGTIETYLFGDKVPGSGQYYMIKEGVDKIFIVWNNYGNNAKLKLKDLMQVETHEFILDELEFFRIHKNGEVYMEFENIRNKSVIEASVWQLTKPYVRSVSTVEEESFYSLADEVMSVAPSKVLDTEGNIEKYGLDEPWLSIDYVPLNGEEISILFGDEIEGKYPMMYSDSDIIYEGPKSEANFTRYETIDVVERLLMLVNIKYVNKVEMTGVVGDNTLIITEEEQKDAEGNVKLNDDGTSKTYINYIVDGVDLNEDEREQGSWFYQSILGVNIKDEADSDFSPGKVVGKVELELNKEPFKFVIEFYEYNDYFYAVKFYDNDVYMVVNKEDVNKIAANYELLRKRELESPY